MNDPKCKITVVYVNGLQCIFGEVLRSKEQFLEEEFKDNAIRPDTIHVNCFDPATPDQIDTVVIPTNSVCFIQVGSWSTPSGIVAARSVPNLSLQ